MDKLQGSGTRDMPADSTVQRPHSPPYDSQPGKTVAAVKKTNLGKYITKKKMGYYPISHQICPISHPFLLNTFVQTCTFLSVQICNFFVQIRTHIFVYGIAIYINLRILSLIRIG